jgi:diguanylate cyclase (GGDEF)-like protein
MSDQTPDHHLADDQQASDRDQTSSDRDHTTSDDDQTGSDRDQSSSDADQQSSDDDQDAADDDLAAGSDRAIYDRTRHARERAKENRDAVSRDREEAGASRFGTANERDRAATERDFVAESRDRAARARDLGAETRSDWHEILLRAQLDRERAAIDRDRAADDRAQAAADRMEAARERGEAVRMQEESAGLLRQAATDQLTGVRTRYLGLDEAARELERTRRTDARLLLAFVDVDGLEHVNESKGHLAGDALLQAVGKALEAHLRPYDVIVRYGGDEFVCVMSNVDAPEARIRFDLINRALAVVDPGYSVSVGLAQARPGESLEGMIERADAELFRTRRRARQASEGVEGDDAGG